MLQCRSLQIKFINVISIIAQMITEIRTLRLVKGSAISSYNHPARGDYNTEALISKWSPDDFLMFLKKKRIK